ncbi:MAG: AAA family ATPase [Armatimonadota bacterium]
MVITLSRETEAGGDEIASLLSERGGLRCADRTLIEEIARREGIPMTAFALFDTLLSAPVEAVLAGFGTPVNRAAYLKRMVRTLLMLEHEDDVVLIGRGAAFVLADPGTLHVRVVAPIPCRVARLIEREGVHPAQARRVLAAGDDARARFVRESFGAEVADPTHYDLTLSTAEISASDAADVILLAARKKAVRRSVTHEIGGALLAHAMGPRGQVRPRASGTLWREARGRSV